MTKYNKALSLLLVVIMCFGIAPISVGAEGEEDTVRAVDYAFDENEIVFTFANLSDTHIGFGNNDEILERNLEIIKKYAKNGIDAVLFNGDQTQDGTREQAQLFTSIVKDAFDVTKTPVIITHGNHDVYWSGCMTRAEFVDAYGQDMYLFDKDMSSIYKGNRHVEINGYHFITVDIETYMPNYNTLSSETEVWLKNTLDRIVASSPDSYVFVSCHSPAKDTVYGSMSDDAKNTGNWGASVELDGILKDYPQVVLFSGHTHYGINLETNITQSTYTQINSGSASDIDFDITTLDTRRSFSQGMIVEVDKDNNIRVTRIDLARDSVIKTPWYIDAYKEDGSSLDRYSAETRIKNNTPPCFPEEIDVVEVSSTEIRIDFKSAMDDDMVFYYEIKVENENGTAIATKTIVPQFYNDPQLQNMPESYSTAFTGSFRYPYTVRVRAYDCFYEFTEIAVKMVDKTEENAIIAANIDKSIDELLSRTLTEADLELVISMRKEINKLSYKIRNLMNRLDAFEDLEREYYNNYFITSCSKDYAPNKNITFSMAPMSSRGWVEDSDSGVKLNWKDATKNYLLGFNSKVDIDGLHIGFTNLAFQSENKVLGILLSNVYKDKWLSNECLLINVDFSDGNVSLGSGASLGRSDLLVYSDMGSIPFDFKFNTTENGDISMSIVSPLGTDMLTIPAVELEGMSNLADSSGCYVSISPWATKSTASVEITAIHTEEDAPTEEPANPGDPENPSDIGDNEPEQEKGFFELIAEFFVSIFEAIGEFFSKLFGG